MLQFVLVLASLASFASIVDAECANACNGHGKCTSYDMCICNRNWQANDCSERTCLFGLAHVDSPKGDLDMSGALSGPDVPIVDNHFNYPYGTTEQFPQMEDSDLQTLTNSAHYYMECSNKGTCNRATGECQCYDGYDGVACQRASCPGYPNSCSGHGVCKSISQLADADHGNVYKLWDKDATMGCECDHGYYGPDCSLRECKHGVDPLYLDDAATVRFSSWDLALLGNGATAVFTDGQVEAGTGQWAIRYYDSHGEDWLTGPIDAGASCADVVAALEALPNNVIPASTISCNYEELTGATQNTVTDLDTESAGTNRAEQIWYYMAWWEFATSDNHGEVGPETATTTYTSSDSTSTVVVSGHLYRLRFYGNPGKLREPEIEIYLDGKRPSLTSELADGTPTKLLTKVWTDGQQGESIDHFADHCDGVTVTIGGVRDGTTNLATTQSYLTSLSTTERALLKACLGDSDFDTSNNVDVYNWDHGSKLYPHIVKLVRTVTTYTDGGYYAVIWFDESNTIDDSGGSFMLMNQLWPDDSTNPEDIQYDIYTTKATLALTSNLSEATFGFGSKYVYMGNVSYDMSPNPSINAPYDGDISCEIGNNNAGKMEYIFHCLNKTDMFTMINWESPLRNPAHINLYTAERLYTSAYGHSAGEIWNYDDDIVDLKAAHYQTHVITTDINTNWGAAMEQVQDNGPTALPLTKDFFHVYKFFPSTASQYEYVAECSNRGICDTSSGECKCFSGYTSDSCGEQISVAC